jgi:hypothetical protein
MRFWGLLIGQTTEFEMTPEERPSEADPGNGSHPAGWLSELGVHGSQPVPGTAQAKWVSRRLGNSNNACTDVAYSVLLPLGDRTRDDLDGTTLSEFNVTTT